MKQHPKTAARKRHAAEEALPRREPVAGRFLAFIERRALWIVLSLVLLGSLRIVSTYTVFNQTWDEPAHIACGMEWLQKGVYAWEPQHPPLARVATALLPYVIGLRETDPPPQGRY